MTKPILLNGKLLSPTLTLKPSKEELLALAKVDPKTVDTYCNFCEHLSSKKITTLSDMSTYGCTACLVGNDQRPRYVTTKSDSSTSPLIAKPHWCPKKSTISMVSRSLYTAKPRLKIDDLKLNQVYVCPPLFKKPLRLIKITSKYMTYCRGQVLNSDVNFDYISLYDSDLELKFLTPLREVKSPFPK